MDKFNFSTTRVKGRNGPLQLLRAIFLLSLSHLTILEFALVTELL